MPFTDAQLLYPHELTHDQVLAKIDAVLARSPNAGTFVDPLTGETHPGLADPALGFAHAMWRLCLEYGLNPAWCLVSLQRERSLLGKKATSIQDFIYAFGYVGQDAPGQKNPRWNGLFPQLWLCVHQSAWIAGIGSSSNYGVTENLRPGARRWFSPAAAQPIQLYSAPGMLDKMIVPTSMKQHVILTYTPHAAAEDTADQCLHQFAPEFE